MMGDGRQDLGNLRGWMARRSPLPRYLRMFESSLCRRSECVQVVVPYLHGKGHVASQQSQYGVARLIGFEHHAGHFGEAIRGRQHVRRRIGNGVSQVNGILRVQFKGFSAEIDAEQIACLPDLNIVRANKSHAIPFRGESAPSTIAEAGGATSVPGFGPSGGPR